MIQSVERAIDILQAIHATQEGEAGLVEVAKFLNLEKATVFNLIKTLRERGFVEQDGPGGRYRLGQKLHELARGTLDDAYLKKLIGPLCEEISEKSGENVSLITYRKGELTAICRVISKNAVIAQPNEHRPFYTTASGRCILASMTEEHLKNMTGIHGLPGEDWDNIDSFKELDKALSIIRETRFSKVVLEKIEVVALAVLLDSPVSFGPLSLAIFMPLYRFNSTKEKELTKLLKEYSKKIELLFKESQN